MLLGGLAGGRLLAEGSRLHVVGEFENELNVHIGLEKCTLQLFAHVFDEGFVDGRGTVDAVKNASEGFSQSV
jgi:hypothetical protein